MERTKMRSERKGEGRAVTTEWDNANLTHWKKERYAHKYISRSQVFIVASVSETDFLIIAP